MNKNWDYKIPAYDKEKMKRTIELSKKQYLKQIISEPVNSLEFLFEQMQYLSKNYWITQILVFFTAVCSLVVMNQYNFIGNKAAYCAILTPLLIIFAIPELWKNISAGAFEVENTTYFDLRKLYFARLLLVGMLDLIIATILVIAAVNIIKFSIYEAVIYFFVPFNFTSCICFSLLCRKKRLCSEVLALGICIIQATLWYVLVNNYHIYAMLQMKIWYLLLLLSFCYMVFAGKKIIKYSRYYCEIQM
ncbi:hypothetical protein [Clostridium sp. JS66]|uniref:hypothetical protein n=1 Tax=Clostridium sp. JS66 TaxID=3064705 RepID=UPI00298E279D|nr:hypothetical protein [Clostridium sp. JS66]WPC44016.1 hypothetical protein Q6H37_11230 [Clostridium sp. JS66]